MMHPHDPSRLTCEQCSPLLTDHLFHELDSDASASVASHLAGCESCRDELQLLESAANAVAALGPSNDELKGVDRAAILARAKPMRRVWPGWLAPLAAAAMALVLLWVFTGVGKPPSAEVAKRMPMQAPEAWVALGERKELQAAPSTPAGVATDPAAAEVTGLALALPASSDADRFGQAGGAPPDSLATLLEVATKVDASDSRALRDRAYSLESTVGLGVDGLGRGATSAPGGAGGNREKAQDFYRLAPREQESLQSAKNGNATRSLRLAREAEKDDAVADVLGEAPPSRQLSSDTSFETLPAAPRPASAAPAQTVGPAKRARLEELAQRAGKTPEEKPAALAFGGTAGAGAGPADGAAPAPGAAGPRALADVARFKRQESESKLREPQDWKRRIDEILTQLDRRPGETPGMMFFRYWGSNPFVETVGEKLSTFAVDVDTGSYTLFRNYLFKSGVLPPPEAIRTEEFVNYFKGGYAPPAGDAPFAIHLDAAPSPFGHESGYQLVRVGIKAREVARGKRKPASLVFVVDTSGSMRQDDRIGTVREALRLLVNELDEGDTIGIVAFDADSRTILEPVAASARENILAAIATLEPRSNTNVHSGLTRGYAMAVRALIPGGINRVVLLSDGVANTGNVDPDAMLSATRSEREKGIDLTCVGVGLGNHNEAMLEALARGGNGVSVYFDRIEEARKIFVEQLTSTLETVARDAKIQVEFNPEVVLRYRQLGYENRGLTAQAFRDNTVDAGEVGAGHEVTALYELKLKAGIPPGTLATVHVRSLSVEHREAQELQKEITTAELKGSFAEASVRFQLASCVAEAAEVLRESYWARGSSLDQVARLVEPLLPALNDNDAAELVALLKRADALVRTRQAAQDVATKTYQQVIEAVKENRYLRGRLETEERLRGSPELERQLNELRQQNDTLRQKLEGLLRQ